MMEARTEEPHLTMMLASVTRALVELRLELATLPPSEVVYFATALDAIEAEAMAMLRMLQQARDEH